MSSGFGFINPPSKRNPARGKFFVDLAKSSNAGRITGGPGILVSQTGSGVTISAKTTATTSKSEVASEAQVAVPCKITGGNSVQGYTVKVYANGKDEASTDTGILSLLEVNCTSDLPSGSWVIGFATNLTLTGGTEA